MASFPGVPFGIFLLSVCAVDIGLIQVTFALLLLETVFNWIELKFILLTVDIIVKFLFLFV